MAVAALLASAAVMLPLHAYAYEETPGISDELKIEVIRGAAGGLSPWVWVGIGLGVVAVVIGLIFVYGRRKPKKARRRR